MCSDLRWVGRGSGLIPAQAKELTSNENKNFALNKRQ